MQTTDPGSPVLRVLTPMLRPVKRHTMIVIITCLVSLTVLNLVVMGNLGGVSGNRITSIVIGILIIAFTLLLLIAIYYEYRRRFPGKKRGIKDIICIDCKYFAGKTMLCKGCPRNPYEKKGETFDILETI